MKSNLFRNATVAVAMTCALAACSGGDATSSTGAVSDAGAPAVQAAMDMPQGAVAAMHDADMASVAGALPGSLAETVLGGGDRFADLADHGDLVAYPDKAVVRRAGPYTWHRADVSETHALQAIVDGVLTLTSPSGQALQFAYDRHVEHASGDWTWIGHVVGGDLTQDVILTFGEGSVFGNIAQPGKAPLNLTVEDGVSWLVETDTRARALQSGASGRYDRPDFLLPPELALVDGIQARADQAIRAADAATAATTTVDVLVGYTDGFAAAYTTNVGNRTPITTRINHLATITNESYVNSQVDAQVRVVHTMQVAYTDANDNSDALSALTGSTGSTPDPDQVDPVLKPLHAARNEFGADLVSLIRDFQHPEAVSCGVAWLIGGGENTVHIGYNVFGMSVVSDGADGGYFCETTTFAHELGHNMGLAHDKETAQGDDGVLDPEDHGIYSYSFGYRTGPTQGNFYTVMAYSDEQEHGYHVFSNPDVTCEGFPCGVENQADNARTLRSSIGLISMFRDTVVTDTPVPVAYVRDDVDGDGKADLFWRNNASTRFAYWLMDGATRVDAATFNISDAWSVVARGDLNGDGFADIVWSNGLVLYLWAGDGVAFNAERIAKKPNGWDVVGAGDVDGDGNSDLIWRNAANTRLATWRMDGTAVLGTVTYGAGSAWELVAIDDFDGDARTDLAWTNGSRLVMWTSTGNGFDAASVRSHPPGWNVVDSGDVDGDGNADLLWRSAAEDKFAYWGMDGASYLFARTYSVSPQWTLASAADYDGDGDTDLTWTNNSRLVQWQAEAGTFNSANAGSHPGAWNLLR